MSLQKTSVGNLPISVSPAFTSDDIALILGTYTPDAVLILDGETRAVVAGNLQFLHLLGLDMDFLESRELLVDEVVYPSDRGLFDAWYRAVLQGDEGVFGIRLVKADSDPVSMTLRLKNLRWKRRTYVVAFAKEVSALESRITQLKRQVEEQKERAFEAIKSSLRLYQFNEKIKRTPRLAKSLLNVGNEEQLFSEAAQILTSEDGLNYREASFLLLDDKALRIVYSTISENKDKVYPLKEDSRFSRFIRHSFEHDDTEGPEILVPLQSRGQFLGIFEVVPHNKEKMFFEESSMVVEWQRDVLQDIGGILALLVDNLRLTREIKRQSVIDPLTEAYNRHFFVGRLASEVRRASRYGRPTTIIFIDIDRFKQINDTYGHLQGDEVLRDLGRLFSRNLREVDVTCRYGGDEFVILLPETDMAMAQQTAEKLRLAVENHQFRNLDTPTVPLPVTISVGVTALDGSQNEDQFIQAADAALYRAKNLGRNKVAVHRPSDARQPRG